MVATKGEEAREAKSGERGVGVTREVSVIGVAKELAEDRDGPFPECDGDLASCQHVHDVIGCGTTHLATRRAVVIGVKLCSRGASAVRASDQ